MNPPILDAFNSYLWGNILLFLGSSPDRGRSPIEWGEIPSVRTSIHPSFHCPSKGSECHLVGSEGQTEGGGWTGGWMEGRTDGISPQSTGLCPLSGSLPCYPLRFHDIKEAGRGYRWPHDAFWRFILALTPLWLGLRPLWPALRLPWATPLASPLNT